MRTHTPGEGEEIMEMNTGNRRGNRSYRRTELVQLHTAHIYLKVDTPEVGVVVILFTEKIYILEFILNHLERN